MRALHRQIADDRSVQFLIFALQFFVHNQQRAHGRVKVTVAGGNEFFDQGTCALGHVQRLLFRSPHVAILSQLRSEFSELVSFPGYPQDVGHTKNGLTLRGQSVMAVF
jgi:hypothetical protein